MTWTALVALCLAVWVVQASVIKRQAATPSEIVFNETDRPKGLKVVFATEQSLRLVWTFDTSSWKKVPDPGPQEELSAPLGNSTTEKPVGEEEEIEAEEEEENEDVTLDGYRIFYEHGSYEDVKTLKTQLESFRYELKGLGKTEIQFHPF